MKKLLAILSSAVIVPVVVFMSVSALGQGQVEGGDIYRVRNVTKSTDFTDPVSATCNETVQFKVRVHNPGPSEIQNVTVTATLPSVTAKSHVSKVTVSSPYADPSSTSDTATVNLDKEGKLTYVAGSTELLGAHGAKISTLGDTILTTGVNIGKVGVSIEEKRYVQFSAKVSCPEAPKEIKVCELATKQIVTIKESDYDSSKYSKNLEDCATKYIHVCELATKQIVKIDEDKFDASKYSKNLSDCEEPGEVTVCEIETKNVVTIKEDEFDSSKYTKDLSVCEETPVTPPTELPKTGAGQMIGLFSAVTVAGAAAHRLFSRRFVQG